MSLSSRVVDIGHFNSIFRVVILSVSSIHKYNFIVILTKTHTHIYIYIYIYICIYSKDPLKVKLLLS